MIADEKEKQVQEATKPKQRKSSKKEEESVRPKSKDSGKGIEKSIKVRLVTSKETDLRIYTAKSTGWPEGRISKGRILRGMEDGTYKWSYKHKDLNEQEVMGKYLFNQIEMEDSFHMLDDNLFNAIESGEVISDDEDASPPPKQDAKRIRRFSKLNKK